MDNTIIHPWLSRLAKICVLATLGLILIGAIVTTSGSGMAIPTAPDVNGIAINPPGWTDNFSTFIEHSHRLLARIVGVLVATLCAWLWWEWLGFAVALIFMAVAQPIGQALGFDGNALAHFRNWPAAAVFAAFCIIRSRRVGQRITTNHWLVLVAFVAVCAQAVMGSLRVTLDTSGYKDAAHNLATFHGVFAQAFLALLVVIAARLCPDCRALDARPPHPKLSKFHRMAIIAQLLYFAQLACAAYLRHRNLGLAIPTWPSADGGLLPAVWTHAVGIHFLHTRILPILLVGHIIGMCIGIIKRVTDEPTIKRTAIVLLALIVIQFILGILVIWRGRQPHVTNTHVFTGALICALIAFIAARTCRPSAQAAAA